MAAPARVRNAPQRKRCRTPVLQRFLQRKHGSGFMGRRRRFCPLLGKIEALVLPFKNLQRRHTPFRPKSAVRFWSMIGMYKFSYSVTAAPCAAREETKNVSFPQKACSASARRSDQKALCAFGLDAVLTWLGHSRRALGRSAVAGGHSAAQLGYSKRKLGHSGFARTLRRSARTFRRPARSLRENTRTFSAES
ncbi:hypothetical protein ALCH109712_09710 [Alkalicoccus chagannorensis]